MKRKILAIILILATIFAYAENGILPDLSQFNNYIMADDISAISYGVRMQTECCQEIVLDDGSICQMYTDVSSEKYETFSSILGSEGYETTGYDVFDDQTGLCIYIARGTQIMTIEYSYSNRTLKVIYPAGTIIEANEINGHSEDTEILAEGDLSDMSDDEIEDEVLAEGTLPLLEEFLAAKDAEKIMNFDGSAFEELGSYSILENDYQIDNASYIVFLFESFQGEAIEHLIEMNIERNYEINDAEKDGIRTITLKQYGNNAKRVILLTDNKAYVFAYLEDGLPIDNYTFYKECHICNGSGQNACTQCNNSRKCKHCEGRGMEPCTYCRLGDYLDLSEYGPLRTDEYKSDGVGSGLCPHCGGTGYRWSEYSGPRACSSCNATGKCKECNGSRYSNKKCSYCQGSGNCTYCCKNGSVDKCYSCKGTGKEKAR